MKKIIVLLFILFNLSAWSQNEAGIVQGSGSECPCLQPGVRDCVARCMFFKGKKGGGGTTHSNCGTSIGIACPVDITPNPADNLIVISLNDASECVMNNNAQIIGFEIFNQNGDRMLMDNIPPTQSHTIDVSNLPPGNYFLQVQLDQQINGEDTLIEQFIKN